MTLTPDCWIALCHLHDKPEQRIVHQRAGQPDEDGFITSPEGVYFRIGRAPKMGKMIYRQLSRGGWLTRTPCEYAEQDECTLSAAASRRFSNDPEWIDSLAAYRAVFLPRPTATILPFTRAA